MVDPLLLVMAKARWLLVANGLNLRWLAGGGMMSKMKAGGGIKSQDGSF
jgi:hypothetical protein